VKAEKGKKCLIIQNQLRQQLAQQPQKLKKNKYSILPASAYVDAGFLTS
jgi:hypothetical protein